jgi:hypothetical protein
VVMPVARMRHRIAIPPSLAGLITVGAPIGIARSVILAVRVRVKLSAPARVRNHFLSSRWGTAKYAPNATAAAAKTIYLFIASS